jgi:hypothetical protein
MPPKLSLVFGIHCLCSRCRTGCRTGVGGRLQIEHVTIVFLREAVDS